MSDQMLTDKIENALVGKLFLLLSFKKAGFFKPSFSVTIFTKDNHKLLIKCNVPIKVIASEKNKNDNDKKESLDEYIEGEDINYYLLDKKIETISIIKMDKDTSIWYDEESPLCGMIYAIIGQYELTIFPNKLEHEMSTNELGVMQDSIPLELSLGKDWGI